MTFILLSLATSKEFLLPGELLGVVQNQTTGETQALVRTSPEAEYAPVVYHFASDLEDQVGSIVAIVLNDKKPLVLFAERVNPAKSGYFSTTDRNGKPLPKPVPKIKVYQPSNVQRKPDPA